MEKHYSLLVLTASNYGNNSLINRLCREANSIFHFVDFFDENLTRFASLHCVRGLEVNINS